VTQSLVLKSGAMLRLENRALENTMNFVFLRATKSISALASPPAAPTRSVICLLKFWRWWTLRKAAQITAVFYETISRGLTAGAAVKPTLPPLSKDTNNSSRSWGLSEALVKI
jgi:hypothetical protein